MTHSAPFERTSTCPNNQVTGQSGESPPAPARVQLRRVKGWRMPDRAVKVDRATILGNPFVAGSPGQIWWPRVKVRGWHSTHHLDHHLSPEQAVAAFQEWFVSGWLSMPINLTLIGKLSLRDHMAARRSALLLALPQLSARPLACWCPPGAPCHADMLLRFANWGRYDARPPRTPPGRAMPADSDRRPRPPKAAIAR